MRRAFHADARFACGLSSLWRGVHERAEALRAGGTNQSFRCIAAVLCAIASVASAHAGTLTAFNGLVPAAMQAFNVRIAQAQAVQTITFGALANQVFGTAPFTVSATASSGLPVSFSSSTTPVCTVSGNTVTLVKFGGCTISASQAGNANFAAAPSVYQHFNVTTGAGSLFGTAVNYATGPAPEGVALGDFNGDGKLDAAVVNFSAGSVGIYIGHGDGTFTLGQTLSTGVGAVLVVVGDFNRDGKPDLAITNVISNTVSIFLGNGNGTFAAGTQFPTGLGPFAIAVADFNGDGKPDLVVGNGTANSSGGGHTLSVLLGNGDGTFQAPVPYATGTSPTSIVVADVNGDGKADLVVANYDDNNVGILLGHGDGTFAPQVTYGAGFHPGPVAVADFNSDGKLDLVLSHNLDPESVSILFGNGDGTFGAATIFSPGSADGWVFVGDFNGDGQPDLAIASQLSINPSGGQHDNAVFINLGNGDGTFQAPLVFTVGTQPLVIAMGDLNSDGKTDLVVTNGFDNTISVLLHSANSGWPATVTSQSGTPQTTVVGTAFSAPLVVSVRDGSNNPLVGAVVSFTAPTSGASGTFTGGLTVARVTTNASGLASAPTLTANATGGTFSIIARVGTFTTTFALTNNRPPAFTTAAPPNGTFNTAYSFTVAAAGFPAPTFSVSTGSLPTGLALNGTTGVISGTPVVVGTSAGTLTATNGIAPAATQAFNIVIAQAPQTITFGALANQPFGTPPISVSATASSGLPVSFSSLTPAVCTVSGNTVTLNSGGVCALQATQAGDANFLPAASINQSFTVTPLTQTISFGALSNQLFGAAPFAIGATASSGLPVNFSSLTPAVCAVSGNTVTLAAGGGCTIRASQSGNANFSAAPNVDQSFTVTPATQSITFGALGNRAFGTAPFAVSATASSGLAVSFSLLTAPVCTLSGNTVTLVAVGTCTVRASQAGNANFSAAPNVDQSFTVTQGVQTITFGALASKAVNAAPFTVSATASSGLAVSFSSLTAAVCSVTGNTVTLAAVGTCTIRASQSGDANFSAAPNVDQSFTVTQASQTISFGSLSNQPLGAAPFAVSATASSGLAVTFSSLTTAVCTVSGNTVTLVAGGTCTIRASQAGDASFSAAPNVDQSFTVTQASQTISFGALANQALGSAPFTVSATASSGLPVSFSSLTAAVCTVSGTTVTLVAGGTCTIRASQAGNTGFGPAPNVDQSFTVTTPVVTLTAPAANAVITTNTPITATASDAGAAITRVEFFIDGSTTPLQTFIGPPYTTTWDITSVANGPHTIKAVATDALLQTAQDTHSVTVQKAGDTTGPTVTNIQFNGVALSSGDTVTSSGTLAFQVTDPSGVQSAQVKLDGNAIVGGSLAGSQYSIALDFGNVANGGHVIMILATDTLANPTTVSLNINVSLAAPPAPTITSPANNTTVRQSTVSVSGTAEASSQVQLYLNGTATGALINATSAGSFSGSVTLAAEGSYGIQADARNAHGTGPKSSTTQITLSVAAPSVVFTSPPANATLSTAVDVGVSVVDPLGITGIALTVDGNLVATLPNAAATYHWDVTHVADGVHALRAVATNTAGRTGEATRNVTVQNVPPPPPPIVTSYTGEVTGISPATSYGTQPILITGRAKDRSSLQAVPNATLKLVFQVGAFQRKITLATDASGAFAFNFVPQASDAGTYIVSAIHPDETALPNQGQFTINRVSFNYSSYSLNAARGFASTIPITARASAGSGVSGVRFVANPADQPSGNLPPGISIDGGAGIALAAGASAPLNISFTGSTTAGATGTIFLTALASDSGSISRGSLRIDYRLSDPLPALYPTPTFIETGVQQGNSVSATVSLQNRGLIAATDVQVRLVNSDGSTNVPAWIYLASANQLGTIDVGQTQTLQINAMPSTSVGDGIYNFKLHVAATNAAGGDIPVAVSLTQAGQGNVVFDVADIYTNTLDTNSQPIPGLADTSIRIQNENVLTVVQSATSNVQGIATVSNLPTGTYIYRASAPNHADASGRILVRPGVTTHEHVFLDYNVISIEFGVTETTIQDHYDVTIIATYNTVVPAPVVLIEPLSVNLPDLQVGEEYTGELTITNYGLVRADHAVFTPPSSDTYYRFEFLGVVPEQLEAKSRISVPYRVTALQLLPQLAPSLQSRALRVLSFRAAAGPAKDGSCSSYGRRATLTYDYTCANGDSRGGSAGAGFSKLVGTTCGGSTGGGGGGGGIFDPGGFGGPGGGPSPIPLTPACTPDCPTCHAPGSSPGGGGGPSSGGGSGGGAPASPQ